MSPLFRHFDSVNRRKNRCCGKAAALSGREIKKGRPDKWLHVGGTKAGPAVLWLYPFGGAPNGHKPEGKSDSSADAPEASAGIKFVMECRQNPFHPRLDGHNAIPGSSPIFHGHDVVFCDANFLTGK